MNRHTRRAAAARARGIPSYKLRVLQALTAVDLTDEGLSQVFVTHDDDCAFQTGRCTCRPDIALRTGGRLMEVGDDGEVQEASRC
jgi:hypothetical protein